MNQSEYELKDFTPELSEISIIYETNNNYDKEFENLNISNCDLITLEYEEEEIENNILNTKLFTSTVKPNDFFKLKPLKFEQKTPNFNEIVSKSLLYEVNHQMMNIEKANLSFSSEQQISIIDNENEKQLDVVKYNTIDYESNYIMKSPETSKSKLEYSSNDLVFCESDNNNNNNIIKDNDNYSLPLELSQSLKRIKELYTNYQESLKENNLKLNHSYINLFKHVTKIAMQSLNLDWKKKVKILGKNYKSFIEILMEYINYLESIIHTNNIEIPNSTEYQNYYINKTKLEEASNVHKSLSHGNSTMDETLNSLPIPNSLLSLDSILNEYNKEVVSIIKFM